LALFGGFQVRGVGLVFVVGCFSGEGWGCRDGVGGLELRAGGSGGDMVVGECGFIEGCFSGEVLVLWI